MARRGRVEEMDMKREAVAGGGLGGRLAQVRQQMGNPGGYILIAPAMLLYLAFNIWPVVRGLAMAFMDYRWIYPETQCLLCFNGLENWREMFSDPNFRHSVWVTIKFTLGYLPTNIGLALFMAVLISKVRSPLAASFYRIVVYLPVVLPISVAMLVWGHIYHVQWGYINYTLKQLGVAEPPNWMGSAKWILFALLIPTVWKNFGYNTLLFLIGMYNINQELYEAAAIDGANAWQQFRHITIPQLRGIFTLVMVLSAGAVGATQEMLIMFPRGSSPMDAALTTGLYAYRVAFLVGDMRMGYGATVSLFLGLIAMANAGITFALMRGERA